MSKRSADVHGPAWDISVRKHVPDFTYIKGDDWLEYIWHKKIVYCHSLTNDNGETVSPELLLDAAITTIEQRRPELVEAQRKWALEQTRERDE